MTVIALVWLHLKLFAAIGGAMMLVATLRGAIQERQQVRKMADRSIPALRSLGAR